MNVLKIDDTNFSPAPQRIIPAIRRSARWPRSKYELEQAACSKMNSAPNPPDCELESAANNSRMHPLADSRAVPRDGPFGARRLLPSAAA